MPELNEMNEIASGATCPRRCMLSETKPGDSNSGLSQVLSVPALPLNGIAVQAKGGVEPVVDNMRLDHPAFEVLGDQITAVVAVGGAGADGKVAFVADVQNGMFAIHGDALGASPRIDGLVEQAAAIKEMRLFLGAAKQLFLNLEGSPLRDATPRL